MYNISSGGLPQKTGGRIAGTAYGYFIMIRAGMDLFAGNGRMDNFRHALFMNSKWRSRPLVL